MNHSAPKILYTASSSAHLVSFHLPYLAALRSLGWDVTAAANGSGEGLGEGVRFLAVPFTKSFASPKEPVRRDRDAHLARRVFHPSGRDARGENAYPRRQDGARVSLRR